jgi:hypothetical protein
MSLHSAIEASLFFEQHLSFFVGEECCLIVLSSSQLHSPAAATASGIDCIHIHGVVVSSPTLSFAF